MAENKKPTWATLSQEELQDLLFKTFAFWRKQREPEPQVEDELEQILHPLTRGGS
jgi:hypothetical protein